MSSGEVSELLFGTAGIPVSARLPSTEVGIDCIAER